MTFEEVFPSIPADGWLTEGEARLLWDVASRTTGPILECGCYKGRSTCLLASFGRRVYAVDPFSGFSDDDPRGDSIAAAFAENVHSRGLWRNVVLFRQRIEAWHPMPVGLAYLDGDHTYQGTRTQIATASLCNPRAIAIHDVNDGGDGLEIKRAALEALGPWTERVERLAVWEGI